MLGIRDLSRDEPDDDGIGIGRVRDWLVEAGHPIRRTHSYGDWLTRFETTAAGTARKQRPRRCCRCCTTTRRRITRSTGRSRRTDRFRAAVQEAKIGPTRTFRTSPRR